METEVLTHAAAPEQPDPINPVAPDLLHKVETLKVLAMINALLNQGTFQFGAHDAIAQSLGYIKAMHEKVMAETLAHPDAEKVPDLKPFLPKKDV